MAGFNASACSWFDWSIAVNSADNNNSSALVVVRAGTASCHWPLLSSSQKKRRVFDLLTITLTWSLGRVTWPRWNWSPVSIQTHATQALPLRAMRKPQATQVLARATVIGCFEPSIEHSYWLAPAFVAWKIESILSLRFLAQGPLASVAWLALACFCFCLRNFLAFFAHFLFCLRTFPYVRPCVGCVRLNGNRAWR